MKTEIFTAEDGKSISLKIWDDVPEPKGVVQIIHGMSEHILRYGDFAGFLNANGYIVVGDDHRAHGDTDIDALGLAGEGDLFHKTVADEKGITELIKQRYNLPIVVMGHSYGSFLTQRYLSFGADDIAACIIMGSAFMKGFLVNFGKMLAGSKVKRGKGDEPGYFFAMQTFAKYDKKINDGPSGWLCRDHSVIEKYASDPKSNFLCSNGFYYYMFNGIQAIAADKGEEIRKDLPLMIISGSCDGVGGYGKLVKKLYDRYVKFGLSPKLELVEGARHELLNETDKEQTYNKLLNFMNQAISK